MNKQRLAILILALVGIVSVFLPWMNMPIVGSVNGAHGTGWLVLVFFLIPAVLTLLDDRTQPLEGIMRYGAAIPALICAIQGVATVIRMNCITDDAGEDNPFAQMLGSSISVGIGLVLVIIAGLGIVAAAFLIKDAPKAE